MSYGVTPALLLLSYGKFDPVFLPGAFLMLVAGVIRLSYFSTFGLADGSRYTGLAIDNNSIAIVFLFLFESMMIPDVFAVVLYAAGLGLAALNVSQISTPKLSGKPINVVLLATYTLGNHGDLRVAASVKRKTTFPGRNDCSETRLSPR